MKRQRGQTATIDVDGTDSGSVNSGGDADLFVFGNDTGAITAAGNINLEASGSFGSTALAGLDANVQVSGNLDSSTITAGTSGTGDAAITGASAAGVNWTAAGTLTADTLGSILVGTLTATTGDVDLTTGGSATVTLSAPGTGGNVNELIVGEALGGASAGEDVNLTVLGSSSQAVTAGQDADVLSAGSLSASAIIAGGEANVETWGGSSAGLVISGVTGANLLAYGSVLPVDDLHPSSITSSAGAVTVMVGGGSVFNATSTTGDLSVLAVGSLGGNFTAGDSGGSGGDAAVIAGGAFVGIVSAGQDVTVLGLSDVSGTFTAAQDSEVVSLGNLEGEVDAGQDAYVLSMGDMGDPIAGQTGTNPGVTINAQRDVYAVSVGDMTTTLFAGRNVAQLMSYGSMDIVGSTVAGSIQGVQAWGDISGAISAGTAITSVTSANNVTATTTAPTVGSVTAYQPATGNLPAAPQVTVSDLAASLNAGAIGMAQLTASVLASQAGAGLAANAALANAAIVASQPPVDVGAILASNAQALGYASQAISTANQEATINLTTQQAVARYGYAQATQTLAGLQAKDQATVATTYDNDGNAVEVQDTYAGLTPTVTLNQTYDADAQRTQVSTQIGSTPGTPDLINNYTYDDDGNITQVQQTGSSSEGADGVADKQASYTYNADSQVTGLALYSDLTGTDLVAQTTYGYDDDSRLTSLSHALGSSGSTTLDSGFGYDLASRMTSQATPDGSATLAYDNDSQLLSVTPASGGGSSIPSEGYTYDANGNRTSSGGGVNTVSSTTDNQLTSDGTYDYAYDADGNMTSQTAIDGSTRTLYTWDYRNRLTEVQVETDTGTDGAWVITQTINYAYDPQTNNRIAQTVTDGSDTVTLDERYIYDATPAPGTSGTPGTSGDMLLAISVASSSSGAVVNRYLYGPGTSGGDQVLAQEGAISGGGAGTVSWAMDDQNGSVTDVIDSSGTVLDHIIYDSFGNIVSQTSSGSAIRMGYDGMVTDTLTGLDYDHARYYDPQTGAFISVDPMGYAAGDTNLYRFVGNNPATQTDPTGFCADEGTTQSTADPAYSPLDAALTFPSSADTSTGNAFSADEAVYLMLLEFGSKYSADAQTYQTVAPQTFDYAWSPSGSFIEDGATREAYDQWCLDNPEESSQSGLQAESDPQLAMMSAAQQQYDQAADTLHQIALAQQQQYSYLGPPAYDIEPGDPASWIQFVEANQSMRQGPSGVNFGSSSDVASNAIAVQNALGNLPMLVSAEGEPQDTAAQGFNILAPVAVNALPGVQLENGLINFADGNNGAGALNVGLGLLPFVAPVAGEAIGDAFGPVSGSVEAAESGSPSLNILNPDFTPNATTLNKVTAFDFYTNEAGFTDSKALQQMGGIDFSQPVNVTTIPGETTLQQYVGAGGVGNYFSPVGTTPLEAGIDASGRNFGLFQNTSSTPALQSFAAPDYLYPPGAVVPGSGAGGGVQFFIPNKGLFAPVP